MDIETIRKIHSVKVCKASGVIVRPLEESYLYILTNYHVIVDDNGNQNELQFEFENSSYFKSDDIKPLDKILCKEKDIAIIKINAQGLERIQFLQLKSKNVTAKLHVGFSGGRIREAIEKTLVLYINHQDGKIKEYLTEYQYDQQVSKDEIEGMSGGGVFDENLCLIGIHKQSSNDEASECLGKAAYVPILCYTEFLKENGWSPIQEFDLSSFLSFTSLAFKFDDAVVKDTAELLLYSLDKYKELLEKISPEEIINTLKTNGRICADINVCELNKDLWIDFTEFLIGIMSILDISEIKDDFIISIYDQFHFVFLQKSFDFYEVREKLDPNMLLGMRKTAKLFIGGLNEPYLLRGCFLDNKIPNVAKAGIYNQADITRTQRDLLKHMTIINAKIFRKGIAHCIDVSVTNDDVNFETYRNLLIKRIQK